MGVENIDMQSRTSLRWVNSLVVVAATMVCANHAAAGTSQEAAAEMRFQEARALMEQGNFVAACPKLAESQQLDPAVGTLLYLGECYFQNGQTATAWATFLSAAEAARRAEQPDREKIAQQRANEMLGKVSKLVINVPIEARLAGLDVKLDGTSIGTASWGVPTALDPGSHTLAVTAPHRASWSRSITIPADGSQATVAVPVLAIDNSAGAAVVPMSNYQNHNGPGPVWSVHNAPANPEPDTTPTRSRNQKIIGVAVGGVGVVGLATGTIFGLVAKSKESDSSKYCWPNNNTSCGHQGASLISDAKQDATIANIGFVVGGLGLATGAVLYLTAPKVTAKSPATPLSSLRVAPAVHSRGQGFSIAGEF